MLNARQLFEEMILISIFQFLLNICQKMPIDSRRNSVCDNYETFLASSGNKISLDDSYHIQLEVIKEVLTTDAETVSYPASLVVSKWKKNQRTSVRRRRLYIDRHSHQS